MKVIHIMLVIYLFVLNPFLSAKSVPRDVIFYGLDQDIARLKLAAISIEKIEKDGTFKQLGSGCLVDLGHSVKIITCHHLLKDVKKGELLIVGLNSNIGKVYYSAKIVRSDSGLDLSLLSIDRLAAGQIDKLEKLSSKNIVVDQAPIDNSIFADSTEIREGLSALMIGFPLGLGAEIISNYPITRIGIIAQVIPNQPVFLIDGMVSHGNSGSPVFSGYKVRFIGIIKGAPADRINAFDIEQNLVLSLPYNSGLTYCISALEIEKFLYTED